MEQNVFLFNCLVMYTNHLISLFPILLTTVYIHDKLHAHVDLQYFKHVRDTIPQNRDYTNARLLGFSYDFGITVILHQNAD
jgi:hypothetical protein